jgi:beta-aspartyl-peptidase (threonine type)
MKPTLVVHGGAGAIGPEDREDALRAGCLTAAREGWKILERGGSALDAVERAACVLEDDPLFNAGTGSCLNADGDIEMDAALMDGRTLSAGAVGAVRSVRNPIRLARRVMQHTPHVLLVAAGAERFADEVGFPRVDNASLVTARARARWEREKREGLAPRQGTIGAVAVDREGHVASATSTGGLSGKRAGRVGDTPLLGAGTYADDHSGAASATGHGESILKVLLSKAACDALALGAHPREAARSAVALLQRVRGEAGIILVDRQGRFGLAFNTPRMSHAWVDGSGAEGSGFLLER